MILASLPLMLVVGLLASIDDGFAVLILVPALCFVLGLVRLLTASSQRRERRSGRETTYNQTPSPSCRHDQTLPTVAMNYHRYGMLPPRALLRRG
jgi:hypothetical protein